jgi:hypothetical protein
MAFTLLWISIFTIFNAHWGVGLLFALVAVPHLAIGIRMVAWRFVVRARRREQTCYAVTDRRAMIVGGGARTGSGFQSIPLLAASQIMLRLRKRNGEETDDGDVVFGALEEHIAPWLNTDMRWALRIPLTFQEIANARQVKALIDKVQASVQETDD